jgi:hypothetical protein
MPSNPAQDGTFVVGGNTIRTAACLEEYLRARQEHRALLGRPPKRVFHVIQPEYCRMLGIDPDEMIAVSLPEIWVKKFVADIPVNFQALPATMALPDRIFEAHLQAYGGGMVKIMRFVKARFFRRLKRGPASGDAAK